MLGRATSVTAVGAAAALATLVSVGVVVQRSSHLLDYPKPVQTKRKKMGSWQPEVGIVYPLSDPGWLKTKS